MNITPKPGFRNHHLMLTVFLPLVVLFSIVRPLTGEEHDWTGAWDTHWKTGGARIEMEQKGKTVTGNYPTRQGYFTGEAQAGVLTAQWREGKESGKLTFSMSSDGQSFTGRFDDGEWWSGRRIESHLAPHPYDVFLIPDLSWPRETLRSFLIASGFVDFGENDFITSAMNCCVLGDDVVDLPIAQRIAAVTAFSETIDQATFRIWDLPGETGHTLPAGQEQVTITLPQAGTHEHVVVSLVKRENEWKILVPPVSESRTKLASLLRARGVDSLSRTGHHELSTPRDTMKSFFVNSQKDTPAARHALRQLMDLTHIDPSVRHQEAVYFVEYLKAIVNRAGFPVWQEIPDDPKSTEAYVHFKHPKGDLAIAPVKSEDGQTRWKFTSDTLHHLPDIHEDIISLPPVIGTADSFKKPLFMHLRDRVHRISPSLIKRDLYLENWQWFGLTLSLMLGYYLARLAAKVTSLAIVWRSRGAGRPVNAESLGFFIFPLFIVYMALLWKSGISALGLPIPLFTATEIIIHTLLIIGLAWATYNIVNVVGKFCFEKAQNTKTTLDDIFVSLLSGLLKIIIVVAALVLLADTFQLPYHTVLAGIGIGGLAIAVAARDTLANFIGSAVLLADRPFRRGDLVSVSGIVGTISHVGLRSTDIRTDSDALLVIPNAVLVNEKIINMTARRNRRFQSVIGVVRETPLDRLDALRWGLLELMAAQPNGEKLDRYAGVWEFTDSAVEIKVSCFIDAPTLQREYDIRHDLSLGMLRLVGDLGIELAYPIGKKPFM